MMRQRFLLHALLIVIVAAVVMAVSGCSTAVGPAGPPGEDGNANVVAGVVEITNADWFEGSYVYDNEQGGSTSRSARVFQLNVPEITQEIFDLGMVHVFMLVPEIFTGPPAYWAPLPYQYMAFGDTYYYNFAYTFDVGRLKLYYFHTTNNDGTFPPSPFTITLPVKTFKYVITSATAIESMASEGVDAHDLDEVMRFLSRTTP